MLRRIAHASARKAIAAATPIRTDRIVLMHESFSGSNCFALHKFAGDAARGREVVLYKRPPMSERDFAWFTNEHRLFASARMIVSTHDSVKPTRRHISVQLWHGFPMKGVAFLERQNRKRPLEDLWRRVDHAISYGASYTTTLSACLATDPRKFVVTGAPRNDFLFRADGPARLASIFGDAVRNARIAFFMPTFREPNTGNADAADDNPFGLENFSPDTFDRFLDKVGCKLIVKPHPHDERAMVDFMTRNRLRNMLLLRDADLEAQGCDVYELLNGASVLLTDYSSVCLDFLLLDRPMVFCPIDFERYRTDRGFVLEPYDRWTAGPKARNQASFETALERALEEPAWYQAERAFLRDLVHQYQDDRASERVWNTLNELLDASGPRP